MTRLNLHLLGSPEIQLNDQPVALKERKALALLVYLTVTAEPHQREALATLLWPEQSASRSRSYLRRVLWGLRQTLGDGWLETAGDDIQVSQTADIWIDVTAFEALIAQSGSEQLEQAVTLYRGDFLAGFSLPDSPAFDEWQFFEAETLRQTLIAALDNLVRHDTQVINYEAAIGHARRRLSLDPLHEPAHQTLMRLYARSGRQAAALRQFDECQRILQDELDIAPGAETLALAMAIREKRYPAPDDVKVTLPRDGLNRTEPPTAPQNVIPPRAVFVGRAPQLRELDQALTHMMTGQGQLRIITGEAGAGKTALITEFLHQTANRAAEVTIAIGASDAQTGQVDPFLPFREALLRLIGGRTADQSSGWNPLACRLLLEHGPALVPSFIPPADLPDLVTQAQSVGWQGTLPTPKQDALGQQTLDQSKVIEQYLAVLTALTTHSPLIIVLEDLHWADAASLGLFFRLGRQLTGHRLLVLGTYRVEQALRQAQGEDHPLKQMERELQRQLGEIFIDLEAARRAEGRQLVDGLLDTEPNQLSESFRQTFYQHTGGHPLFVVELLADLKETAALVKDQAGRWVVGLELDWRNLPARVEGAIAGRIGHLSAEQRWLLTIASVSGEHFLAEVVAHVAGSETRQIIQALSQDLHAQHRLVESEGVEQLGDQRLTRYRFRHNLIQVYLYEQLDEVQRVYLHEDVARALERLYREEAERIPLQLARHYQVAGVTDKAVNYLLQAGKQAIHLSIFDEAGLHLSQAVLLLSDLPAGEARDRQELAIQTYLGQAWTASKGAAVPEVGTAYSRALDLARQLGEHRKTVELLFALTQYAHMRSDLTVARAYGEEALRLIERDQDPELRMQVNNILHNIASWEGRHRDALACNEQVIVFYRTHRPNLSPDDAINLAYALLKQGMSLAPCGYLDQAISVAQEGLALMPSHNHLGRTVCIIYSAMIHSLRREWRAVIDLTTEAIEACHTYDFVQARTLGEMCQGQAIAMLGEFEAGAELVRQAIAEREAMGSSYGNQIMLGLLAEAYGPAGQVSEGLVMVNQILSDLKQSNERKHEPELYQIKGDLILLQALSGDQRTVAQQEAEMCFRQAINIAQDRQTKLWEIRALAKLYRLLHTQGRGEECRQQLVDLYDWFTEGFETEDLRLVQKVLAELA